MKTCIFKIVFLILSLTIISGMAFAQTSPQNINLSGLIIGLHYSNPEITNMFGQPTKFSSWGTADDYGDEYVYGNNLFRITSYSGFCEFILKDNNFTIQNLNIRIGNNITTISSLSGTLINKGNNIYWFYPVGYTEDMIKLTVNNSIITKISFSMSL